MTITPAVDDPHAPDQHKQSLQKWEALPQEASASAITWKNGSPSHAGIRPYSGYGNFYGNLHQFTHGKFTLASSQPSL